LIAFSLILHVYLILKEHRKRQLNGIKPVS
jgi:hypothetical protein